MAARELRYQEAHSAKDEHAVKSLGEDRASLLVGAQGYLDGAAGRKRVRGRDELGAPRVVFVALAVADEVDGAVRAREGLPALGHVDDRQATRAESGPGKRRHLAGVVGSALAKGSHHGREVGGENRLLRIPVGSPGDTAHRGRPAKVGAGLLVHDNGPGLGVNRPIGVQRMAFR